MFGTVFFCMGLEVLLAVTEEYGSEIGNSAKFIKCSAFQKKCRRTPCSLYPSALNLILCILF
jgi:hypothetical protein